MGHYSPVSEGVLEIVEEIRRDLGDIPAMRTRAFAAGGIRALELAAPEEEEIFQRFKRRGISLRAQEKLLP